MRLIRLIRKWKARLGLILLLALSGYSAATYSFGGSPGFDDIDFNGYWYNLYWSPAFSIGASIYHTRNRLMSLQVDRFIRIDIKEAFGDLADIMDDPNGYKMMNPLHIAPEVGGASFIAVREGGTVRMKQLSPNYSHVQIRDDSNNIVAETFNNSTLEWFPPTGRTDYKMYRCDGSGCNPGNVFEVLADDSMAFMRITKATKPVFGPNCLTFNHVMQISSSDGSKKVCATFDYVDFAKENINTVGDGNFVFIKKAKHPTVGIVDVLEPFVDRIKNASQDFKDYCNDNSLDCSAVLASARLAQIIGKTCAGDDSTESSQQDTGANAAQHMIWNYLITKYLDEARAKIYTDLWEGSSTACDSPVTGSATEMDCKNNALGRVLATSNSDTALGDVYSNEILPAVSNNPDVTIIDSSKYQTCAALPQ